MLLAHYHHHTWFLHDLNLFGIASWVVLAWVHLLFPLFCYIEDNVEIKCGGGDYFWLLLELVSSSFGWLHLDYVFGFKMRKFWTSPSLLHLLPLDMTYFWTLFGNYENLLMFLIYLLIENFVNGIDALWLTLIVLNLFFMSLGELAI